MALFSFGTNVTPRGDRRDRTRVHVHKGAESAKEAGRNHHPPSYINRTRLERLRASTECGDSRNAPEGWGKGPILLLA